MAARYLGVAPWELAEQPISWVHAAEACMEADHTVSEHYRKRAERKQRRKAH